MKNEMIIKSLGGIHLADPVYLTAHAAPQMFELNDQFHLAIALEAR